MVKAKDPELVKLGSIRTDGGTQVRLVIDEAVVEEFAQAMGEGAKFPRMVVFFDGKEYWLADGFHRRAAYEKTGENTVHCDVQLGDVQAAKWYAVGANRAHGLRRTEGDKANAIKIALEAFPDKSDREIARRVGVSNSWASEIGRRICADRTDAQPPQAEAEAPSPPEKPRQVKRGGKTYPMRVAKIGKGRKSKPRKDPGIAPGRRPFHPAEAYAAPVIVHITLKPEKAVAELVRCLGRPFVEALYLELKKFLEGTPS